MQQRNWDELDILFISGGDAYIDHPAFGTSLLARMLENQGYRVGIIDPAGLEKLRESQGHGKTPPPVCSDFLGRDGFNGQPLYSS